MASVAPDPALDYAAMLCERLRDVADNMEIWAYLHGSAAFGDWQPDSDVDVLLVYPDDVSDRAVVAAAAAAIETVQDAPPGGLEASAVTVAAAATPGAPWSFLWHVSGVAKQPPEPIFGHSHSGDPDLCLHYAVTRAEGVAIGDSPAAAKVIGAQPASVVRDALATELQWGLEQTNASYALLNACRALRFQRDETLTSKLAGGEWVLAHHLGPADSIRLALKAQKAERSDWTLTAEEASFIADIIGQLRA